jgi:tetratricopeptide (TPR) repeat protein
MYMVKTAYMLIAPVLVVGTLAIACSTDEASDQDDVDSSQVTTSYEGSSTDGSTSAAGSTSPQEPATGEEPAVPSPDLNKGGGGRETLDERAQQYLVRGQRAFQQGNYERAVAYLDSAEQVEPRTSVVPFNRGRILMAVNQDRGAQRAFEKALHRDRNYPDAREQLGDLERQRGNNEAAIDYYRGEEQVDPTPSLYVDMGTVYDRLGKADSARAAYERAIALDSSNAEAHMMYGQFLEKTGNLKEALEHSRKALSLEPDRPNYQFAVGSQLYQLGQLKEAVPHLKKAADARLLHYPAQHNLGQVLMRLGREEEAERYMARADSSRALMDTITSAQSVATRNPKSVDAWIRLGKLFRRADEQSRAIRAFSRAASLEPNNLQVRKNIGEVMLREGHPTKAIPHFRAVLQSDQSQAEVWMNLSVAYAKTGDCARARRVLNAARSHHPDSSTLRGTLRALCP